MKNHNQEDYELVMQFVEGDQLGFKKLMEKYKNKVFTYIFLTVKDKDLANDIFQDTFLKVINSLKAGKYQHNGKFPAWVMRIAHNLIIDYFRKCKQKPTYNHEEKELDYYSNKEFENTNIEDKLIKDQTTKSIRQLVEELPDDQREVVILRHYVGMSFKEIASQTNVSINTALGRMRYAIINLRKMAENKKLNLVS